jgi:hypothetical protein
MLDYKLRTNITKHLQARSKAIRSAVTKFNNSARAIKKPTIAIKEVLSEVFLDDFHLLCDIGGDVSDKQWANRDNRQLRDQYYKLLCAESELNVVLPIEIDRVQAWMKEERATLNGAITELQQKAQPALAAWMLTDAREHDRKCQVINHWLIRCQKLDGYSARYYTMNDVKQPPLATGDNGEDEEAEVSSDVAEEAADQFEDVILRMERLG